MRAQAMIPICVYFFFGSLSLGQFSTLRESEDLEETIIKGLESKDVEVRRKMARISQFMFRPPKYWPPSEPPTPPERWEPKKALPALLKALNDPDPEVRQLVAGTLKWFNEASKPAVPVLAQLLKDMEVKVRRAAAESLLELGSDSKMALPELNKVMNEIFPALTEAMKDSDKLVCIYSAATTVVLRDEGEEKVIEYLMHFASDKDEDVRYAASGVFTNIGLRAITYLKNGLNNKDPVVRDWTLLAFISIIKKVSKKTKFPADTIPLIINAINDENSEVARSAIYAVSRLGFEAKEAVPVIIKRFKDPNWEIRYYAINLISEFGSASEAAVPALKEALNDKEEIVRINAKRAIIAIEEVKAKKTKMP
jgi:HEAT repeat protein